VTIRASGARSQRSRPILISVSARDRVVRVPAYRCPK
jgi:hypothetical protein